MASYQKSDHELTQDINFYRFIVENSHVGTFVIDDNYHVVYGNAALEKIFGYDLDEINGSDFRKYIAPEGKEQVEGEYFPHVSKVNALQKDGTVKFVEISVTSPVEFVNNSLTVVQVFDITDQKSEERYRTVLEEIEEGYCEADLSGKVIFINQAGLDAVGYSKDEILSMDYMDIYSIEDQVRIFQAGLQVYDTGEPCKDLVVEVIKKDGSFRQHEMSIILIRDKNDKPCGFRGISRDVTARKQQELELEEAYSKLDERVMERTAELAKTNKALESKSKGLGDANTALRVLLEKKDESRIAMEERMVFNVMEAINPMLEKLKGGRLPEREQVYVELIEEQLNKITSPFSQSLSMQFRKLTPTEIQIANLIKHGKKTKEIAKLTCLAQSTIESHRKNIRKKFKIDNQKVNLRTYLLSLDK